MSDKSAESIPAAAVAAASRRRPWEELPEDAFSVWKPELPALAREIIAAIREEVPAYSRPFEGVFGKNVARGVEEALRRFGERRGSGDGASTGVYLALGRGESREGRSLEALLAAYRVGARVAWRRLAASGVAAGMQPQTLALLAEGLFAYIDELSAESAEGYAREQALRAGETDRRREACARLLLRDPPASPRTIADAAEAAAWPLPSAVAVVVWPQAAGRRPVARLPLGTLTTTVDAVWCAVVPDPTGPGRRAELAAAAEGVPAGLGTTVEPAAAGRSLRRALGALELAQESAGDAGPRPGAFVAAEERRTALLLRAEPGLMEELATARLAPLAGETPRSRRRLEETLLAWLRHEGNATAAGQELGVHGQTVRYRLGRLRELLGPALDDPDVRFELELALRARGARPAALR